MKSRSATGSKQAQLRPPEYCNSIIGDVFPAEKIDTYLERRPPRCCRFVVEELAAEAVLGPRLSTTITGALAEAHRRSVEPKPFKRAQLGVDEAGWSRRTAMCHSTSS